MLLMVDSYFFFFLSLIIIISIYFPSPPPPPPQAAERAANARRPSPKNALVLGVGMSTAPRDLYLQARLLGASSFERADRRALTCSRLLSLAAKGFRRIVCVDVSPRVVLNLNERYKEFPGIEVSTP